MSASPSFEKVGECLYRNPSSGTYFARVKLRGKEIKQSLETNNLPVARRKLKDFKAKLDRTDPAAGRITLAGLANKYEKTIQHFAPDTIANKARVLMRVRETWPGGADRLTGKTKSSEAAEFLSRSSRGRWHDCPLAGIRHEATQAGETDSIDAGAGRFSGYRGEHPRAEVFPTPQSRARISSSFSDWPGSDKLKRRR